MIDMIVIVVDETTFDMIVIIVDGTMIDDYDTLVFRVGEYEVVEGLDLAVQVNLDLDISVQVNFDLDLMTVTCAAL